MDMLKPIALSFTLVSLGQADTFVDMIQRDWNLINYKENFDQKGLGVNIGFLDSAFYDNHRSYKIKLLIFLEQMSLVTIN
ncbi:hypothetical protein [Helicobacter equorum]|uniref:hypothetical protein n=1 Tax=Helicobacter equorum TaxID=361872 RepID=UPI000CF0E2F5|nr:hypothetical protein [Helicobacter equorum]